MTSAPSPGLRWNWPRVAVFAGVVIAVIVLFLAIVAAIAQRGEARPGTKLDGVDVGGMKRAEVLAVANSTADERRARVVTVQAGSGSSQVRARTLGVKVDAEASTDAALEARHGGITGPFHALTSWLGVGHEVAPVASLREPKLDNATDRVVSDLAVKPSNGGFTVSTEGDETTVKLTEPRTGVGLDQGSVSNQLRAAMLTGRASTVALSATIDEPEAGIDAAREVTEKARALLTADFVLKDDERELTLKPEKLGPALRAEPDGDGGLRLTLDEAEGRKVVKKAAEPLTKSAKPARLKSPSPSVLLTAKGDATYKPKAVSVSVTGGRKGYEVDVDKTVAAISTAAATGARTAALPGKVTPIPETSGDLDGIDQVIGSFTTYFPCCQPRVTNINRMADIVDGTVVAPGDTFSLNGVVGRRTLEGGFVEDHAIVGDRLEEQIGGGVSQFSTTLMNAVWFAGLPSLQHQPHTAYISRYPAVREATLDFGNIDNLWRNETKYPIVVRTVADGGSVTVALYGHTGDRSVTSITSKRQPKKDGGFKASVARTVKDNDKTVKQDSLTWTYRGPLKTEAEIKAEEKAKKKKAEEKKKSDAKASASASPRD